MERVLRPATRVPPGLACDVARAATASWSPYSLDSQPSVSGRSANPSRCSGSRSRSAQSTRSAPRGAAPDSMTDLRASLSELCGASPGLARQAQGLRQLRERRRGAGVATASALAAAAPAGVVPGISLQHPGLLDTAPVKHRLPGASPPGDALARGWSPLAPFWQPLAPGPEDDPRRTIVKSAPRATAAELSTAAQMARLSSLVYHPDPSARLEALGLELKECRQTPYTAYFVADGPADLGAPGRGGGRGVAGGGRTRYIIARGVAMDRDEVKWGDLWMKLLRFWPVEFERGLTPRGSELLVHEGVKEIAEQVYAALLPFLAFDPKKEGITAVRFGGHSLGGSLSLLLMLMFHLRSPLTRGFSDDLDFNSHTFGSFPVLAALPALHLPWEEGAAGASGQEGGGAPASCPLMRTLQSLRAQLRGAGGAGEEAEGGPGTCSVLANLGLPQGAARGFVMDSDIVPRAFMALKHDAVRSLLQVREKVAGPSRGGMPLSFQQVGLVHYMQSQGEEVSVASLQPRLAEAALHMDVDDFLRNPSLLVKSIQDHYFNHYVSRLDSAVAAARLHALQL